MQWTANPCKSGPSSFKTYLAKLFKLKLGYDCNFDDPVTFNEKLQWLKLYDRKPIYTDLCDKYKVNSIKNDLVSNIKSFITGKKASGGYVDHGIYELGEQGTETVLTAQ